MIIDELYSLSINQSLIFNIPDFGNGLTLTSLNVLSDLLLIKLTGLATKILWSDFPHFCLDLECWRIHSCQTLVNLAEVRAKTQDGVQSEIIGVARNDEVESSTILQTPDVECFWDVIQKQRFLSGVRFWVQRTAGYLLDLTIVANILGWQDTPNSFHPPWDLYQTVS